MQVTAPQLRDAKALGAFYTPSSIADTLAHWVVRTGQERLLEPSVGEGALLAATLRRAEAIAGHEANLRVLVCDIDPAAIAAVKKSMFPSSEARVVDFLQLDSSSTGKFQGVILNPPFTRNHDLPAWRRLALRQKFSVDGAAGLWVHFLLHSLSFLSTNGRLAAIVPSSALFSRYGRQAVTRICERFANVEIRQLIDRPAWVNGAAERGALILAEGFGTGRSEIPAPSRWSTNGMRAPVIEKASAPFDEALSVSVPLESLATLSIGVVTGYNRVFLLSESERVSHAISVDDLVPVAARSRHASGLIISVGELHDLALRGEKTWLLAPHDLGIKPNGVRDRLAHISASRRRSTVWFNKRNPWWSVSPSPDCDAIFTYMNDRGPRLILAEPGVKCTNTLHRVVFHPGVTFEQRAGASLSLISTFGQLAAERVGRAYGGGIMKFELCEARRLPMLQTLTSDLEPKLLLADHACRIGDAGAAQTLADELLLPGIYGANWRSAADDMAAELKQLRRDRHGR